MLEQPTEKDDLPEQTRKELFHTLVQAQDQGAAVADSRRMVAGRFGVSESQVRRIEREGLNAHWPPL
jgi:hypothetical protein